MNTFCLVLEDLKNGLAMCWDEVPICILQCKILKHFKTRVSTFLQLQPTSFATAAVLHPKMPCSFQAMRWHPG